MSFKITQMGAPMACFVCEKPGHHRQNFNDAAIPLCTEHLNHFTDQRDAMVFALDRFLRAGWKLSDVWLEDALREDVYGQVFKESFDEALTKLNHLIAPTQSLNIHPIDEPARVEVLTGRIESAGVSFAQGDIWKRAVASSGEIRCLVVVATFLDEHDHVYVEVGNEPLVANTVMPAWAFAGMVLAQEWKRT